MWLACFMIRVLCILLFVAALPDAASGQRLVAHGVVYRDTTQVAVPDALVTISRLGKDTRSNAAGEFRFDSLPSGVWAVLIQKPGFTPTTDSLVVPSGSRPVEYRLKPLPQELATVTTTAAAGAMSPNLRAFEERRLKRLGAYITPEQLRRMDSKKLSEILRTVSGAQIIHYGGEYYLASSRGTPTVSKGRGTAMPLARASDDRSPRACWVQIFMDGLRLYVGNLGDVPDLAQFEGRQFEAIEFYRGPAVTPTEFNLIGATCGTLVLWSRER